MASDNDLTIRKIFSRKSMYWLFILYIVDGITVNFYSAMFASYLLNEFLLKAETIGMILASGAVFNSLIGFVTGYLLDRGVIGFFFYWIKITSNKIGINFYSIYFRTVSVLFESSHCSPVTRFSGWVHHDCSSSQFIAHQVRQYN